MKIVLSDVGNIGELERSTPELEFASTIWTDMTSHIVVGIVFCTVPIDVPLILSPQGIYPAVIVIVVHSQKSYIDDTTTALASLPRFKTNDASPTIPHFDWDNHERTIPDVHLVYSSGDAILGSPSNKDATVSQSTMVDEHQRTYPDYEEAPYSGGTRRMLSPEPAF